MKRKEDEARIEALHEDSHKPRYRFLWFIRGLDGMRRRRQETRFLANEETATWYSKARMKDLQRKAQKEVSAKDEEEALPS